MTSLDEMSPAELAALLHFHADAGVEWLLEDHPVDRIAAFAAAQAARGQLSLRAVQDAQGLPIEPAKKQASTSQDTKSGTKAKPAPAPRPASRTVAIPDEQAVAEARIAAAAARSLEELKVAMETFGGCNLKNSARNLVFADGDPASGILIVGPAPNGDDDRDGRPFSGRQGAMLDRMLAAIGLTRAGVLVTNVIPWRPPGNRMASAREIEICRPFIERQIALATPRRILVLGNFTARFFFGGTDTIHDMRGTWRTISLGDETIEALATLHPQDLIAAPICKRLAWHDLQLFSAATVV